MQYGTVLNIQKYSIHDGPGIRTTVFLKGCPLRCWWCHNPESQSVEPEVRMTQSRCMRCGECVAACPQGTDGSVPGSAPEPECTRCGACAAACPTAARQMVGQSMTVDQVLAEVRQDQVFYDDSGGGVTFSGGEPLMQPAFLRALLQACRSEGFHTAVDTCGHAPQEELLDIASLVDLFLYDLKIIDDTLHRQSTGMPNATILDNLRALGRAQANIWIRIPILPGWNDSDHHIEAAARVAASVSGVQQVNVLPYHELGRHKSTQSVDVNNGRVLQTPSPQHLDKVADKFRALGLSTRVGG